jgi:pimeloyl-ACP methyl ester carboxylesterase
MEPISLGDTILEVDVRGSGEPIVLIQTALVADELLPLADQPVLRDAYRIVAYHRRGYGGSDPVAGPGSIERDAADCDELLAALGIDRAHVVGLSYSGAVALQLAAGHPNSVHSLTLIEPPPVHIPSSDEFVAANAELRDDYNAHGSRHALDRFLTRVIGPGWRDDIERTLPGVAHQVERDAATFFETDMPALLSWQFGPEAARRIDQPTLYVGGSESGPWWTEVHTQIREWLPQTEDTVIDGADHSLATTHPAQIAEPIVAFLRKHPIGG